MALLDISTDLASVLRALATDGQLSHLAQLPAREASYAEPTRPLPSQLLDRLPAPGLWSHQARAIDLLREGRSVAIATGTASGKSLCYQLPVAEAVSAGPQPATALLVFPTKALAQDQLRSISSWEVPGLLAATYDGDTPADRRAWVRSHANVVLTNPEMLHQGLLPYHGRWATFLMRLRYVVIDELHLLRGVFGSHVGHLLRRLRRLCHHYGSSPTFAFCSATIGEPGRLASELCGLPVEEIVEDGSPRGERLVALWDPGEDSSLNREAAGLMSSLVAHGHRTLTFARSRKGTEILTSMTRQRLPDDLAPLVRAYRGGYLAAERRELEAALFGGQLRGVVATTALEVGVDVGTLDACVLAGFPGTIASFWQQAGRSGRQQQPSLAVLVTGDDQLDRWMLTHPGELLSRPPEPAVVNLANPRVLHPHLAAAAYELPLSWGDERWWPGLLDEGVRSLVAADHLRVRRRRPDDPPRAYWAGRGGPASSIGLRSSGVDEVRIATVDGTLIGTVGVARAPHQVHPGAVYLHQGTAWQVRTLELDEGVAVVEASDGTELTQPRTVTDFDVLCTDRCRLLGRLELGLGWVRVRSQVTGFRRFSADDGKLLGVEDLDLPPSELETRAVWWTVPEQLAEAAGVDPLALPGSLHAAEHAAIAMLPLFTICDRWDVGGVSTPRHPGLGFPTVMVYDGYAGGAGIADLAFDVADRHLAATRELILSCRCTDGCPSCVQSPKCGNGNDPLDKPGAIALLGLGLDLG